jgi:peptidoglycan/LPS O-acetylase OafA/YrhL
MSLPGIDKTPMGFEVAMVVLFSLWVIYAIGCNDYVLQNRFTKYISGISMEIYLCHMVIFRVIERIHLEKVVGNAEVLYILTCVLTIVGAVIFSHVMKFWILPKVENLVVRK